MPSQPLGFLVVPPDGDGPGVLVLHAWWGLNKSISCGNSDLGMHVYFFEKRY